MIITSQGFGHFTRGLNNQDFGIETSRMLLILDGCSGAKYSEVGTRLFAQLFSRKEEFDNLEKFEVIRGKFAKENELYQEMVDKAGQRLEYAFDFMEYAFGNSQEMTAFVTELNTNFYSIQFLQNYECERYYQYNKNLLFDEKRRNILNRIENL